MRTSRLVGLVVLALGPLIAPYAAGGQTPGHVYRVGIILLGGPYHVLVDGLFEAVDKALRNLYGPSAGALR